MPILKVEFEKNMVEKASTLKNIVRENLDSLQSINKLFEFNPGKSTKLTKYGHSILCKVGLLKNIGGKCGKCGKDRKLINKNKGDGLIWKCTSCKKTTQSIRHTSIFTTSKLSLYELIIIIHQFSARTPSKNVINLLNISDKTISEWYKYLRNAQTRILLQIDLRIGGKNKICIADETYIYRPPKNNKGRRKKWRNWLLVIVEQDTTKFACYLLGKRTRPAIETIVNEYVRVGTTIKTDEHKAYYWLGKTTSNKTFEPCRPALYIHKKCNHSVGFKAYDGTHTNEIEGQNNLIKHPYKAMSGLPKHILPQFLDQLMFEGWTNSVLPYSEYSHSKCEKDKMFNNFLMLLVGLSELYCQNDQEWYYEHDFVSYGGKIDINEELYLFYKDQGYMVDENDIPEDDIYQLDLEYNEKDFDFECDNSEDSNFEG